MEPNTPSMWWIRLAIESRSVKSIGAAMSHGSRGGGSVPVWKQSAVSLGSAAPETD